MQIQTIKNDSLFSKNKAPQFRSVYPVVFWVAEKGGSYAPVVTKDFSKTLATKLVNILNYSQKEITETLKNIEIKRKELGLDNYNNLTKIKMEAARNLKNFIAYFDSDFAKQNSLYTQKPKTRSFTTQGGFENGKYTPTAYIMTGNDAIVFEKNFGKPIGLSRALGGNKYVTAELERAIADYWTKGYRYIKNKAKVFQINNQPAELHVKVETVRARTGNIKSYNIIGAKFFPQKGSENPLEKTGWLKNSSK